MVELLHAFTHGHAFNATLKLSVRIQEGGWFSSQWSTGFSSHPTVDKSQHGFPPLHQIIFQET